MIVAVRLALLGLAAAAVIAAVAIAARGRAGGGAPAVQWACPMHPEVRAAAAGECPICKMALERVGRGGGAVGRADAADLAAVENVRKHNIVDFVRRRSLLVPARELRGPAVVDADGTLSALFYVDEIAALAEREAGTFTPADAPGVALPVRRLDGPAAPWDRSTARMRFEIMPAVRARGSRRAAPAPGRAGWIELAPRPRQVLAVPASALVQSPEGPYILAWTGSGFEFEKRPIEIGETFLKQGFAVVLSGLRVNERVVSRATFFLEADRRASEGVARRTGS